MLRRWSAVVALLCMACSIHALKYLDEQREALLKHLLTDYSPSSRPGHQNDTLFVFVDIELQHFDFRERDGAFHLVGMLHVRWRDPKLTWEPKSYGNMSHITISQRLIWVPDLEFYNNVPDKFLRMHRNGFVSVKQDGVVFWSDTIDVHLFCTTQMKNWPHDKHECVLNLGSWTFDGLELDIRHVNANASLSLAATNRQNMQYKVTQFNGSHVSKYYACCLQPYITMDYNITFERESAYAILFRVPALVVIAFTLVGLYLRPERKEKFWLNCASLWIICSNLLYFAYNSHNFTKDIPSIVVFFSASLVLVTVAQLAAVFSALAVNSSPHRKVPNWLQKFLMSPWLQRLLQSNARQRLMPESSGGGDSQGTKVDDCASLLAANGQGPLQWQYVAQIIQLFLLVLFACLFAIFATICFV